MLHGRLGRWSKEAGYINIDAAHTGNSYIFQEYVGVIIIAIYMFCLFCVGNVSTRNKQFYVYKSTTVATPIQSKSIYYKFKHHYLDKAGMILGTR